MKRKVSLLTLLACLALTACGRLQPLSTKEALARLNIATSKVYDANGNVIANLHTEINRDIATLDQIPVNVRNAAVAIEDERFWRHQGIDLRSVIRALSSNAKNHSTGGLQGGSTISQQLAKNLYFPRPARTIGRKIEEARVTYQLEQQYTKSKILEMYLNTIYLGRGTYGVETAARSYFGKSASELTLSEGAFLTGLIHEPARYEWSPSDPPQKRRERIAVARARRNHVLDRMRILHLIGPETAKRAQAEALDVKPVQQSRWEHPYFVDYVLRELGVFGGTTGSLDPRFDFLGTTSKERFSNLHRGGLRIYTTLDAKAQSAAEDALKETIPKDLVRLDAALAAIEPTTGYVRALVGGKDYYPICKGPEDKQPRECHLANVNLALGRFGGGGGRQPGSSFKPFVLAAALERGIPLYDTFDSSPFTYDFAGGEWKVGNYEGEGGGSRTLVDATQHSINAVFAHLEIDGVGSGNAFLGSQRVAMVARRMGVGFPTPDQLRERCGSEYKTTDRCIPADDTPAIALGAKEVSPIDMASAYATFANDGVRIDPTAIVRITDDHGRILYNARPEEARVLPAGVARGVTYALQQVVHGGTGTAAALSDRPAAGKTGTSENWTNAWFDGYVPQLAAAVWVGNAITSNESMTPGNGYPFRVVGGTYPAQIWHAFMTKALDGIPVRDFRDPPEQLFTGRGTIPELTPTPLPTATSSESPPPISTAEPANVPDVIGLNFGDAGNRLRNRGFGVASQSGCDPKGKAELHEVFAQSPGGDEEAPRGSVVSVTFQGGGCH